MNFFRVQNLFVQRNLEKMLYIIEKISNDHLYDCILYYNFIVDYLRSCFLLLYKNLMAGVEDSESVLNCAA